MSYYMIWHMLWNTGTKATCNFRVTRQRCTFLPWETFHWILWHLSLLYNCNSNNCFLDEKTWCFGSSKPVNIFVSQTVYARPLEFCCGLSLKNTCNKAGRSKEQWSERKIGPEVKACIYLGKEVQDWSDHQLGLQKKERTERLEEN